MGQLLPEVQRPYTTGQVRNPTAIIQATSPPGTAGHPFASDGERTWT